MSDSALEQKNNSDISPFLVAVIKGDIGSVKSQIDSVDFKDENGSTALHYACLMRNEELIKLLTEHGAKFHIKNNDSISPKDLYLFEFESYFNNKLAYDCVKEISVIAKYRPKWTFENRPKETNPQTIKLCGKIVSEDFLKKAEETFEKNLKHISIMYIIMKPGDQTKGYHTYKHMFDFLGNNTFTELKKLFDKLKKYHNEPYAQERIKKESLVFFKEKYINPHRIEAMRHKEKSSIDSGMVQSLISKG